ncbi:hypothetical protein ACS0TY_024809 [Phlomoides rotata]
MRYNSHLSDVHRILVFSIGSVPKSLCGPCKNHIGGVSRRGDSDAQINKGALSDNEEDTIDLGFHDPSENRGGQPFCLAGRLCTSRPFNVYALIDVMLKGFKVKGKVTAREWGKSLLIFSFSDSGDREWVLQNQPWHFEGNLFAVIPLLGSEQPSLVKVSRASFWARLYDLPMACQNEKTLKTLARKIGNLEAFDPPANNLGSFLRFKVDIDIDKPFKKGLTIRFDGREMWIPIKYESLPNYCFCCGLVGHSFKFCDNYDRNECQGPSDLDFGPNMKASPLSRAKGQKMDVCFYGLVPPPQTEAAELENLSAQTGSTSNIRNIAQPLALISPTTNTNLPDKTTKLTPPTPARHP